MRQITALLPDALAVAGAGSLVYGCSLIYQPAGFIVGGILLLVPAVMLAIRE